MTVVIGNCDGGINTYRLVQSSSILFYYRPVRHTTVLFKISKQLLLFRKLYRKISFSICIITHIMSFEQVDGRFKRLSSNIKYLRQRKNSRASNENISFSRHYFPAYYATYIIPSISSYCTSSSGYWAEAGSTMGEGITGKTG